MALNCFKGYCYLWDTLVGTAHHVDKTCFLTLKAAEESAMPLHAMSRPILPEPSVIHIDRQCHAINILPKF